MARLFSTPATYRLEMTRDEAAGLAALCQVSLSALLESARKHMGNNIIPVSSEGGLRSLFDSLRDNESMRGL